MLLFILFIFYFLYCPIDYKYEYLCTTGNKNFKCVFLKSIFFFELTGYLTFWLIDLKFRGDLHWIVQMICSLRWLSTNWRYVV